MDVSPGSRLYERSPWLAEDKMGARAVLGVSEIEEMTTEKENVSVFPFLIRGAWGL